MSKKEKKLKLNAKYKADMKAFALSDKKSHASDYFLGN